MSDIHGNSVALDSVLIDIESVGVDKIISTGDLVGYGPFPNEVINTFIERRIPSTLGNHDLATFDMDTLIDLGDTANQSIVITLDIMGAREKDYLTTLPKAIDFRGLNFVHASPKDNVRGYITNKSENEIKNLFTKFDGEICFIGHTHLLAEYYLENNELRHGPLSEGVVSLDPEKRYIINVGSVGQPRDGIYKAKYVLFDEEANTLESRFVEYDIKKVQRKIFDLGLPRKNAELLGPI